MKYLFGRIAARYDTMNRIMSLSLDQRWRRLAVITADPAHPATALDLACGTGDFAAETLRQHPGTDILCVDLTPEMIEIARSKLTGLKTVRFQTGDAQDLHDLPERSFDLITCAFGFRNFRDRSKALSECRRLLKPGGKLVVLELFHPRSRFLGLAVRMWLATVAFVFAHGAGREYAYLRQSVAGMVSVDEFVRLADAAGLSLAGRRFMFPAATALVFK